jgi:hypothetical protein
VADGGRILQPTPSGTVLVRLVGGKTSDVLHSSKKHPVMVRNGFSLWVNESNYLNYFTAEVVSYTAPAIAPCWAVPAQPNNTILTFTPQSSQPISGSVTPCGPGKPDLEGIRISDQNGNSTVQYFRTR